MGRIDQFVKANNDAFLLRGPAPRKNVNNSFHRTIDNSNMCVKLLYMKTASVREIQHHLARVLAWVENGEEVLVTRRNKTIARLVPHSPADPVSVPLPDFAARARAIWGAEPKGPSLSETILTNREERV